jgi:hypothetical protein
MHTRPPSCSGRGPTLQETAFPGSCPFFPHTPHRKQGRNLGEILKYAGRLSGSAARSLNLWQVLGSRLPA